MTLSETVSNITLTELLNTQTGDEPSQFTEGERPRPQGSSPVEEYPEKYGDSDQEVTYAASPLMDRLYSLFGAETDTVILTRDTVTGVPETTKTSFPLGYMTRIYIINI